MEYDDDQPKAPLWLVTYSDMVTLLLALFVMIVSMSDIEASKVQQFLSSFGPGTGVEVDVKSGAPPVKDVREVRQQAQSYETVLRIVQQKGLGGQVKVSLTDVGPHIVITDSVMFRSGETMLLEPSRLVLAEVASALSVFIESVVVTGHSDNQPIRNSYYPSNWELSAARAAAVVRFLQERNPAIPPANYTAVGKGEFFPVASNATVNGRAQNRRVEILFKWKQWQRKTEQNPQLMLSQVR